MIKLNTLLLLLFLSTYALLGQSNGYFVQFSDKNNSTFRIDRPTEFLSQRAIDRRFRQNIEITEEDLPVSEKYTDSLRSLGIDVRYTTKWLNGAVVFSSDIELMDTLSNYCFVSYVEMTTRSNYVSTVVKFKEGQGVYKSKSEEEYGYAWDQIQTVNGHYLHENGYKGEGIQIAVLDAGFNAADNMPSLQHLWDNGQIIGYKDFVNPHSDFFSTHYHGMKVLSIMGGEISGTYLGTAPKASYWLLRTEDVATETPVEPDYWVCAAEFADSVGVDVINSSLGYYEFDSPFTSYTYQTLDGTSRASKAAEIAALKGMVVVVSAGNEGDDNWHYIGVPADAKNILSVAAMSPDSTRAYFSSYGPSYDQRVKPEVAAVGYYTAVQSLGGGIEFGAGTSYSSPVVAGLVASLWQALPNYTSLDIINLITSSSSNYNNPDDSFGYGIPDFNLALKTDVDSQLNEELEWIVSPNPFSNYLLIKPSFTSSIIHKVNISLYDIAGNIIFSGQSEVGEMIKLEGFYNTSKGIYILIIESDFGKKYYKVLKN
ncbi:S8 family serine peptidase [Carboxylicivirga caseinilyticus]|uniref:S8 family serine peptidase n=1 Tax=Carboxylicivirga caseinilyticus TaxID=3417572 RepID=UPI003D33DD8E|nr:S8 family serine peptidase [Marinilabiliaceae bacterium A049]